MGKKAVHNRRNAVLFAAIVSLGLAGTPAREASAHHSFSMFDGKKSVVLIGTVKDYQWTNPHSWIQLLVADKSGKVTEWSLEMSSTVNLLRAGWRPKTIKPGDKITVHARPRRDGKTGSGSVMHAILSNGKTIGIVGNAGGAD